MDRHEQMERFVRFVEAGLARGMTRREFIRQGLRLGLSLPAIAAALAACGRAPDARNTLPTAAISRWQPTAAPVAPPLPPAPDAPTATPTAPTRFAVIGDFGFAGEPEEAVARLVAGWNPEFIVTTGDNNYPLGEAATIDANIGQYYHPFIASYKGTYGDGATTNRFFPVLGNHDWGSGYPQPYLDYFSMPGNRRYYSFTWGPAQFFALDSMPDEPDGTAPDSVQGRWLQGELGASAARWKIVVMHHPPFSSGHHGSSKWMQWPFRDWGAHVVLAGHDHSYERLLLDDVLYFVNGLGGAARYAPGLIPVRGSEQFFNRDHGAMLVDLDEQQMRFQFFTRAGELVDQYQRAA